MLKNRLKLTYLICGLIFGCQVKEKKGLSASQCWLESSGMKKTSTIYIHKDSVKHIWPFSEWDVSIGRVKLMTRNSFQTADKDSVIQWQLEYFENTSAFSTYHRYKPHIKSNRDHYYFMGYWVQWVDKFLIITQMSREQFWAVTHSPFANKNYDSLSTQPKIFSMYPFQGQVPGQGFSKVRNFLGMDIMGNTIAVNYPCFFDTAIVFFSRFNPSHKVFYTIMKLFNIKFKPLNNKELGDYWGKFPFGEAVYLLSFDGGIIGSVGCSDRKESENLVKKVYHLALHFK